MSRRAPATIVAIELSSAIPELCPNTDSCGIYALFFWHGLPLGHRFFSNPELPLTPGQVSAFAAQSIAAATGDRIFPEGLKLPMAGLSPETLKEPQAILQSIVQHSAPLDALIKARGTAQSIDAPTISVAICTKDRPQQLLRCIESILAQTVKPNEIIVVDNDSKTPETEQMARRFAKIRYQKECRKGLSAARNAAMALASSDIVAFLDDDTVAAPEWLRAIQASFADPKTMVVTGLVLPAELRTDAQVLFENIGYLNKGYCRRTFGRDFLVEFKKDAVPVWLIGAGANMAVRKEAFRRGYTFDTHLGPGVFGGCGEDTAYWYDLIVDGWNCLYEPAAVLYHYHRPDLESLRAQIRSYMQGHVAALLAQARKHGDRRNLRRLCVGLPLFYASLLKRLIVSRFSWENRILFGGIVGYFSGLRFVFLLLRRPTTPSTDAG